MKTFILSSIILVSLSFMNFGNVAVPIDRKPAQVLSIEINAHSKDVEALARANGFIPTKRVIDAIIYASEMYEIDALELTAIGIVETGLGKYSAIKKNSNGTYDRGIFQINTVNYSKCVEYNLDSPEGSALCAAKLLSKIKSYRADYLGVYHSKTPSKKTKYLNKISQALNPLAE